MSNLSIYLFILFYFIIRCWAQIVNKTPNYMKSDGVLTQTGPIEGREHLH